MGGRFGALISSRREQRGIKAYELAAQMKRPASFVSRLETETFKEMPPPNVLTDLEAALGLSQAEMLAALGYDVGLPTPVEGSEEVEQIVAMVRSLDDEQLLNLRRFLRYLTEAPNRTMRVPPVATQSR